MNVRENVAKLAALVIVGVFVVGVLVLVPGRDATTPTSSSSPISGIGASPTQVALGATPVATLPPEVNPQHLNLPADAVIQTVPQIQDLTTRWAKQIGATHPQVAQVRLETIKTAMETAQRQIGQPPSGALMAQPGTDPATPVWRILLDGDTFALPGCPAPASPATPDNCGTTTSVQFVVDPMTGDAIRDTFGVQPMTTATP
jgi:hypothetical protein